MKSSELLLSSAERFAAVTATSANISGEQTLRQSRLNIGMQCSLSTSYWVINYLWHSRINLIFQLLLESCMKHHLPLIFSFHLQMT